MIKTIKLYRPVLIPEQIQKTVIEDPLFERYSVYSYEALLQQIRILKAQLDAWTMEQGINIHDELNAYARAIGEELNKKGGKKLMLQAHREANGGRAIEFAWDGVGDWRG